MSTKTPSAREALAERIATFIRDNDLNNPFGGEATLSNLGNFRSVALSIPRVLDGVVKVYGPRFLWIGLTGPLVDGSVNTVFESEERLLEFLRLLLVEHDEEAAWKVPQKAGKFQRQKREKP
jgi:hypothetical protein